MFILRFGVAHSSATHMCPTSRIASSCAKLISPTLQSSGRPRATPCPGRAMLRPPSKIGSASCTFRSPLLRNAPDVRLRPAPLPRVTSTQGGALQFHMTFEAVGTSPKRDPARPRIATTGANLSIRLSGQMGRTSCFSHFDLTSGADRLIIEATSWTHFLGAPHCIQKSDPVSKPRCGADCDGCGPALSQSWL